MDVDLVAKFLFPAPKAFYSVTSFPGELIWLPKCLNSQEPASAERIPALFLPCGKARYLALYFHTNGEDIGRAKSFLEEVRDRFMVHVLAVEYAGYGICSGTQCHEKNVIENANAALDFSVKVLQWPIYQIILIGRSIGTGPAMVLAAQHSVKGVLLISPFLSVKDLCHDTLGPVSYLIEERFPNKELMPRIHSPCLIVHCEDDITIPPRHGKELFELCTSPKRLVLLCEGSHNVNLFDKHYTDFVVPVLDFFQTHCFGSQEIVLPTWALDGSFLTKALPVRSMDDEQGDKSEQLVNRSSFCGCYRPPVSPGIDLHPTLPCPPVSCPEDLEMATPHDENSSLPSLPANPRICRSGLGKPEIRIRAI